MNKNKGFYSFREKGSQRGSFALELVPGSSCQLKCKNCYKRNGVPKLKKSNMPDEFVFEAIRQARDCDFAEIVFIGGEPTLHGSLPKFMKFVLEVGLTPILVTNGIKLASMEYANKMVLEGSTLVLHAPLPPDVQNNHVGQNGYNQLLLQAYKNILGRKGVTVVGEITILDEFILHLGSTYQWCLNNSVIPFIEISRRSDSGNHYLGDASPENNRKIFELLKKIDPCPPEVLIPPAYGQPCTMSITGLHVKNFGNGDFDGVYSCCAQHIRHGNLDEQPLAIIMQKPSVEIFMFQDEWIVGPCRDCQHYPICRGGCRGEAFLTFGCPRASFSCWYIPGEIRNNPSIMAPSTCDNCPLQDNSSCRLK